MLSHIYLKDFAIVEKLELDLKNGMTALTGETGAGKSILIDAIGLVLGDRADSGVVRHGADKAEITLSVDIEKLPYAQDWLKQQELVLDENSADDQCILRRVITSTGKSRAWINGSPCNLKLMRELGEQLVDIHGQHEHQSLMKKTMQRSMLDEFAGNQPLVKQVSQSYQAWKNISEKLDQLNNQHSDHQARLDLLRFQTQELDDLQLLENEITALDEEHSRLSNANELLDISNRSVSQLYDDDEYSIYSAISDVLLKLEEGRQLDTHFKEPLEMLLNAQIQVQEAADILRRQQESIELDPKRLENINQRISSIHELSRKHQTIPEKLFDKWQSLHAQLNELNGDEYDLDALVEKLESSKKTYLDSAAKLSQSRIKSARILSKGVSQAMQELGMEGGKFEIICQASNIFSDYGSDTINFQVSANPGQPFKPLQKVASGGELSRISLAIQMVAAKRIALPALIFDEVDSGIGGGTAEVVGQQLRNLGENCQVLCVTHLPQVASQAHNHYKVTKIKDKNSTRTGMLALDEEQRIEEVARMMGGVKITSSTKAVAEEMLVN